MQVSSVTNNTSTTDTSTPSTLPTKTLNQSDFLNLLVAEMSNQDPMNPMSDTDFVAQMANFTSLEQTKETQASIQQMQANDLIGRVVYVMMEDGTTDTGTVSGVVMNSGTPNILVNGAAYTLSEVQGVSPAPTTAANTSTQGVTP